MRVIAGSARHIPLKTVPGSNTRPTTDRIKETLFNMLQFQLTDASILDLFSGSGAIGIEALSRGAQKAVFVENQRQAAACIYENLENTRLKEKAQVYVTDVVSGLRQLAGKEVFDFIFMDPPYQEAYEQKVLEVISSTGLADNNTVIIIEALKGTDFGFAKEYGFEIYKEKVYKTNKHVFLRLDRSAKDD